MRVITILVLVIMSVTLTQCYVCEKYYIPSFVQYENTMTFSSDGIDISCSVPSTAPKSLFVRVSFQDSLKDKKLNDLDVKLEAKNSQKFSLRAVNMLCYEEKINPLKENRYRQEAFSKLPEKERMTAINGKRVYYIFEFTSQDKIKSKQVELTYLIEFAEDNQPSEKINLKRVKSCSFRIH